ncbi:VOC family protein [Halobellus rufus]|uniref:VOC family protein n=1 Tax=Halobellus rufus TaxID=1448860 RepID=UPI0006790C9C|nr:VOC family protein [Halobellus rufus]
MDVLHAALNVVDLDATIDFYESLLGLERTRTAELDGQRMVWVGGEGDAELQFLAVDEPVEPAGIDHVAVAVDDVEATVEEAQAEWGSSVVVDPQVVGGEVRLAFVTDPDGYHVELIEELD